jgi:hypothetical protein
MKRRAGVLQGAERSASCNRSEPVRTRPAGALQLAGLACSGACMQAAFFLGGSDMIVMLAAVTPYAVYSTFAYFWWLWPLLAGLVIVGGGLALLWLGW